MVWFGFKFPVCCTLDTFLRYTNCVSFIFYYLIQHIEKSFCRTVIKVSEPVLQISAFISQDWITNTHRPAPHFEQQGSEDTPIILRRGARPGEYFKIEGCPEGSWFLLAGKENQRAEPWGAHGPAGVWRRRGLAARGLEWTVQGGDCQRRCTQRRGAGTRPGGGTCGGPGFPRKSRFLNLLLVLQMQNRLEEENNLPGGPQLENAAQAPIAKQPLPLLAEIWKWRRLCLILVFI